MVTSSNTLVMIIPYFGKWPEWFPLYLYSCSKTPIDFYFFTDCEIPQTVYKNTFFTNTSFETYCDVVSQALDIDFHPESAYKLCDLKPFLGIVHSELIAKYDFWAFGDIDLLWGDTSDFLSEFNLSHFDIMSTHSDRVSGHFTLIRSQSKYTRLCLRVNDWKEKLEDNSHRNLDEGDYTLAVYPGIIWMYRLNNVLAACGLKQSMNRFLNSVNIFFCNRYTRRYFRELNTTPEPQDGQVWELSKDGNILSPEGDNLPYLHFLFFKRNKYRNLGKYWHEGMFTDSLIQSISNGSGAIISNNGIELKYYVQS